MPDVEQNFHLHYLPQKYVPRHLLLKILHLYESENKRCLVYLIESRSKASYFKVECPLRPIKYNLANYLDLTDPSDSENGTHMLNAYYIHTP